MKLFLSFPPLAHFILPAAGALITFLNPAGAPHFQPFSPIQTADDMPPKIPKKPAKTAAAKTPGKKAGKKAGKQPFSKPRKAPAAKTKPETWTDAEWEQDCLRRRFATEGRRGRREGEIAKKTSAAQLKLQAACGAAGAASPCAYTTYIPGGVSPSTPAFYAEPSPATPRIPPEFADAADHGGFDPTTAFTPEARTQCDAGNYAGRIGPLQFAEGGAGNPFDGMPASDAEDAAQEEVHQDEGDDEEEEEYAAEEYGGEEEEVDAPEGEEGEDEDEGEDECVEGEEVVEVDATGNRKRKVSSGTRGPRWKVLEDQCLCDSWATVSLDSITGANQRYGAYWARIKTEFDERKHLNKEYSTVAMTRSQKAMSTRWGIIQHSVNLFHGLHSGLADRNSGMNNADLFDHANSLYRKNSEGHKSFVLLHCYVKLKNCEKWRLTRLNLAKEKDGAVDLDAPLNASAGRPVGNKAAKAAALEAASAEKTQASINKCLAEVSSTLLIRDAKADERWATLFERQAEKMQMEKERAVLDKERALLEKERTTTKKRKDDFMLLTASTAGMDPRVMAAHNYYKDMILAEIDAKIAAAAAAPATSPAAAPSAGASASASTPASASASSPATASADRPATASASPTEHLNTCL